MAVAGDVLQTYAELPPAEQEKVQRAVQSLPPAPSKYVGPLWLIVVSAFVVVLLGGTFILYDLIKGDDSTEVIVPIVTAALGVLAGLLAPSPVATR
jgi:hypothetical protein